MITNEIIAAKNYREILYCNLEQYEEKKREIIYELTQELSVSTNQVEIHYLDQSPPWNFFKVKRQVILKAHKDRFNCLPGELAVNKGETEHILLRMTNDFKTIEQKYRMFAIQHIGEPRDYSMYWVRME